MCNSDDLKDSVSVFSGTRTSIAFLLCFAVFVLCRLLSYFQYSGVFACLQMYIHTSAMRELPSISFLWYVHAHSTDVHTIRMSATERMVPCVRADAAGITSAPALKWMRTASWFETLCKCEQNGELLELPPEEMQVMMEENSVWRVKRLYGKSCCNGSTTTPRTKRPHLGAREEY
jgi:hypothetical protein